MQGLSHGCAGNASFPLEHKTIGRETYEELFARCSQSNLLQSAVYGEAKRQVEHYDVVRKAVLKGGVPVAIYQALVKRLPLLGTVVRINRGPLYPGDGTAPGDEAKAQVCRALYEEWVEKERAFLQIAPDLPDTAEGREMMIAGGFAPDAAGQPWESGLVDLSGTEESLRKGLRQKWRNMLNKAGKAGIELRRIERGDDVDPVLADYGAFMQEKKFQSTSSALIRAMHSSSADMLRILAAYWGDRRIGTVIIARHGDSCTYLAGFTSDEGRAYNANYLLLWEGMLCCRDDGFRWFDVGGIDDRNTPGVAHFKRGLGIVSYRLAGEYEGRSGWGSLLLAGAKKGYLGALRGRTILQRLLRK
jgi:lipid II:glycine glycyltransferase (peptidoglycan interpeptide bridge formation enzyme)